MISLYNGNVQDSLKFNEIKILVYMSHCTLNIFFIYKHDRKAIHLYIHSPVSKRKLICMTLREHLAAHLGCVSSNKYVYKKNNNDSTTSIAFSTIVY